MTGKHLQDLILAEGYSINKMAQLLGLAQPNLLNLLKHEDIRTGLVEKVAEIMGKPLAFFYGEAYCNTTTQVSGNNNTTANGTNNTVTTSDDRLLALLLNKDEQLTLAMTQLSKAQEQLDKAQEQINRMLDKFLQ